MQSQNPTSDGRLAAGILVAFVVVTLLAASDLVADWGEGTTVGHVVSEVAVFAVGLLGATMMAWRLRELARRERLAKDDARALTLRQRDAEAEAARWRAEARDLLSGLGAALDRQFDRWCLSPAEKEVALLLLKGLSHKEIAAVRSITEATTRQQARAVYKKADLTGRHDLAAFFLEDLLLPMASPTSAHVPENP